ncbi:hypothetical protein K1T71_013900 [Dendrolimus kikuchii]|uniref:Uncharacterized protein n=1 Tax=Dendrolimus kikuchii TaxID=765133 RepID=A0ACC1CGE4_9NEOP|nr:hypothetical protein K1T71_013900 [Dendrolimus kikuchii]
MNSISLVFACCFIFSYSNIQHPFKARVKRSVAGALHILTNHAQPIHADVKSEVTGVTPDHIEKVTAPTSESNSVKSLRKSWPLNNKLDFVRNINRLITLVTLLLSAVFEFYPILQKFYNNIYQYLYYN